MWVCLCGCVAVCPSICPFGVVTVITKVLGRRGVTQQRQTPTTNRRQQDEQKDQLEIDALNTLHAHASDRWFGDEEDNNDDEAAGGRGGRGGVAHGRPPARTTFYYSPWLLVELPKFRIPILGSEKPYARRAYTKPKRILFDGDVAENQVGQEWVAQVRSAGTYPHTQTDTHTHVHARVCAHMQR